MSQNSLSRGKYQHCGSKRGKLHSLRGNQSVFCSFPRCWDIHQWLLTSCQAQTPTSHTLGSYFGFIKSWNHRRVWAEGTLTRIQHLGKPSPAPWTDPQRVWAGRAFRVFWVAPCRALQVPSRSQGQGSTSPELITQHPNLAKKHLIAQESVLRAKPLRPDGSREKAFLAHRSHHCQSPGNSGNSKNEQIFVF